MWNLFSLNFRYIDFHSVHTRLHYVNSNLIKLSLWQMNVNIELWVALDWSGGLFCLCSILDVAFAPFWKIDNIEKFRLKLNKLISFHESHTASASSVAGEFNYISFIASVRWWWQSYPFWPRWEFAFNSTIYIPSTNFLVLVCAERKFFGLSLPPTFYNALNKFSLSESKFCIKKSLEKEMRWVLIASQTVSPPQSGDFTEFRRILDELKVKIKLVKKIELTWWD